MKHIRTINSHPKHKDVHIRLFRTDGTYETLSLKSNIYYHMKQQFRRAYSGMHGKIEVHSENGKMWEKSFEQIRKQYKRVIQVL